MSFSVFADEEDSHLPRLGPAFLDSGAFSVLTGTWDAIPLEDHLTFVCRYYDSFEIIAAPDVIGSASQTFENLQWFVKQLKQHKMWKAIRKRIAFTYHVLDRDFDTLYRMLDYATQQKIEWLAIGGIAATPGTNYAQRWSAIEVIMDIVRRNYPNFKVHLFGGYQPEYIRYFRPDSVDSSTYLQAARVLSVAYYDGWKLSKAAVPRTNDRQQLLFAADYCLMFDPDFGTRKGLADTLAELPDSARFWLVNALAVKSFETFVREEFDKPFKYWITADVGMQTYIRRFSSQVQQLFWEVWRDRCLLAYPSFYAGPGVDAGYQQVLTMFRENR